MLTKSVLILMLFSPAVRIYAFAETNVAPAASTVVLEVDGVKVTYGELEQKRAGSLFQARNAFYEAEKKSIDDYVNEFLLEREAKKENLTTAQLLEKHVTSVIPPDPSEEALRLYYEGIDAKEPFEAIRGKILDHVRDVRMAKARAAYMQSLRTQANVVVRLPAPRANVSLIGTPVRGAENAPVIIVEYSDYECPYCQQTQSVLDKVEAEYKGKIAFAYKDFPLPMHSHAEKAAEAAHCADVQGKFWDYHDRLFKTKQLDVAQLKESARDLKLDTKAFDECLDSGAQATTVKTQLTDGQSLQVQGTPSFLINGRFFNGGLSYEELRAVIEEELKSTSAPVKKAARE
jgi:protein-disulfide isomerase